MGSYDTSAISTELEKEIKKEENNLRNEVNNLITQFNAYQSQVENYEALNAAAEIKFTQLTSSVDTLTKVIELIKEIIYTDAAPDQIVKVLKAQIKNEA